jgi:hypothetical protein
MNVEKYLEKQLEILVYSLVAIPLANGKNSVSLEEIQGFIFSEKHSGKTLFEKFHTNVCKELEKTILTPINSWLDKTALTIRSPVASPEKPIPQPEKTNSSTKRVSPKKQDNTIPEISDPVSETTMDDKPTQSGVSSSTRVEKIPTPAKKTTKKPPTPKTSDTGMVQTTLFQPQLTQSHPLMTGETLEKTTKKKSSTTPENYTGPTCKYVFKRGELKGKECGKPAMSDGDYCEQCNNKKTNKPLETKDEKPKDKKSKQVENKPMVGFTTSVGKRTQERPKIELRETGPNTYTDIQTNIVVKKVVENDKTLFVAIGIQEESGFRTLNDDEKKEALNRNFTLAGSESRLSPKKIVAKQPVNNIPDIESDNE